MIGYDAGLTAREEREQARDEAFYARIEELTAEIEAAPFEADDLYCGVERAEEKYREEITALINSGAMLKAAEKIAALMDSARARRAEWQAEQKAEKEFEGVK